MADADSIRRPLHPATLRQAGYADWTADPAIGELFAILRDLDAIGARLEALCHDRADLGAGAVRGEIGSVVTVDERCPALGFRHGRHIRANGGACAAVWQLLAARRNAWVDARLEAEGLVPGAATDRRSVALCDAAVPVELAWRHFAGVFGFTPGADSPTMAAQ